MHQCRALSALHLRSVKILRQAYVCRWLWSSASIIRFHTTSRSCRTTLDTSVSSKLSMSWSSSMRSSMCNVLSLFLYFCVLSLCLNAAQLASLCRLAKACASKQCVGVASSSTCLDLNFPTTSPASSSSNHRIPTSVLADVRWRSSSNESRSAMNLHATRNAVFPLNMSATVSSIALIKPMSSNVLHVTRLTLRRFTAANISAWAIDRSVMVRYRAPTVRTSAIASVSARQTVKLAVERLRFTRRARNSGSRLASTPSGIHTRHQQRYAICSAIFRWMQVDSCSEAPTTLISSATRCRRCEWDRRGHRQISWRIMQIVARERKLWPSWRARIVSCGNTHFRAAKVFTLNFLSSLNQQTLIFLKVECGKVRTKRRRIPKSRIIGGNEANPGDWPFLAAILGGPEEIFYCAGVLISDQFILTASHCIGKWVLKDIFRFYFVSS